jgi:hypothetical protein
MSVVLDRRDAAGARAEADDAPHGEEIGHASAERIAAGEHVEPAARERGFVGEPSFHRRILRILERSERVGDVGAEESGRPGCSSGRWIRERGFHRGGPVSRDSPRCSARNA